MRFASQLFRGISRVLQNLYKYFYGTAISTSLVLPSAGALPVIPALDFNDSEPVMLEHLCR